MSSENTMMLKGKSDFPDWARHISMSIQEKYSEASDYIFSQDYIPTDDEMEKRKEQSKKISTRCMEELEKDEPDDSEDVDLYKIYTFKYDRRSKLRTLVKSTIGFIQQRISVECINTIKHMNDDYNNAIKSFNLLAFWLSIVAAMAPKGLQKASSTAKLLLDMTNMKQEHNENIGEYVTRFSKKAEEIHGKDDIKVSESVISCVFLQGLSDAYNGYKNYILNKNEDEIKFVTVKEGAVRWNITEQETIMIMNGSNGRRYGSTFTKGKGSFINKRNNKNNASNNNNNNNNNNFGKKRKCFACGKYDHLVKDCPKMKTIAAITIEQEEKEMATISQVKSMGNDRATTTTTFDDTKKERFYGAGLDSDSENDA